MNRASSQPILFKFHLYVVGDAQNSIQAIANLNALCRARLHDQYEIKVVDVFREPKLALAEGIFMTPTLVKSAPLPTRRIVGNLSQTEVVLQALGLGGDAA